MKRILSFLVIAVMLVIGCFVLTGCGEKESKTANDQSKTQTSSNAKENENETITGHRLKMYSNENSCTIYFEDGKSVKIDVEETLGDNYSEADKEQYKKQKERVYGTATLEGNIVKYTITEDTMYIGQPRSSFTSGVL